MRKTLKSEREAGYRDGHSTGYDRGYSEGTGHGVFWSFISLLIILLLVLLAFEMGAQTSSSKNITIDSKIISIDYSIGKSYYVINFKDGSSYRVDKELSSTSYERIIDFDESDNVIIELRYNSGFIMQNTNNVWNIVKIIKY